MLILGIDPGVASLGYGLVEKNGNRLTAVRYGTFVTKPHQELAPRLLQIHDFLLELTEKYHPDELAVEELFFSKNVTTGIMVGEARGVILLTSAIMGLPIYEYKPMQIKLAVVGYGKAEKPQVQQMVKLLLNLPELPKPDDTADALAAAICHANSSGSRIPRE